MLPALSDDFYDFAAMGPLRFSSTVFHSPEGRHRLAEQVPDDPLTYLEAPTLQFGSQTSEALATPAQRRFRIAPRRRFL